MAPARHMPRGRRWPSRIGRSSNYPADRLSGRVLLRSAEEEGRARSRWTRSIRSCCARTKSSAFRCSERAILAGVKPARASNIAVDAVFDSVSVATTFRGSLSKVGVIFCPISEAVQDHPELVRQYLGQRGAGRRQLLRGAELGRVHRWQLRVHPQGRALPDGAVHLFPHQCAATPASSSAR